MKLTNKKGIHYRKWAAKKVKAVILAVHGMGAHSERYKYMAQFMTAKGISVYSIALEGFGELAQKPGHVSSMDVYCKNIIKLKEIIKKENKEKPVFILGESMGAVTSHMTVLDFDDDFAGLVEIAPVYKDITALSIGQKVVIVTTALFNPSKAIKMPFVSEELTRDKQMLKWINNDKREHKFASAGLLLNFLKWQIRGTANAGKIKIPTLLLLAGKDYLGSTPYNVKLFNKFECDKTLKVYQDSFHALTIDTNRKEIFGDIYKWVKGKI